MIPVNAQAKLTNAMLKALRHRDQVQTMALQGGLDVWLYVDQGGTSHLLLRRRVPAWPSESEILTVLRLWPQPGTPPLAEQDVRRRQEKQYNSVSMAWKPATPQPFAAPQRH